MSDDNLMKSELLVLAQRIGIVLEEDDLAIALPLYIRSRANLDHLRVALASEQELAVSLAVASEQPGHDLN